MGWKDLVKRWSREDAAREAQRAEAVRAKETVGAQKEGMKAQLEQFELEDKYGEYEAKRREEEADRAEVAELEAQAAREEARRSAEWDDYEAAVAKENSALDDEEAA